MWRAGRRQTSTGRRGTGQRSRRLGLFAQSHQPDRTDRARWQWASVCCSTLLPWKWDWERAAGISSSAFCATWSRTRLRPVIFSNCATRPCKRRFSPPKSPESPHHDALRRFRIPERPARRLRGTAQPDSRHLRRSALGVAAARRRVLAPHRLHHDGRGRAAARPQPTGGAVAGTGLLAATHHGGAGVRRRLRVRQPLFRAGDGRAVVGCRYGYCVSGAGQCGNGNAAGIFRHRAGAGHQRGRVARRHGHCRRPHQFRRPAQPSSRPEPPYRHRSAKRRPRLRPRSPAAACRTKRCNACSTPWKRHKSRSSISRYSSRPTTRSPCSKPPV